MKLYHNRIASSNVTATSSVISYPVSNVDTPRIKKSWRSNSDSDESVTYDLGSIKNTKSIWLQGLNFGAVSLEGTEDDPSGSPFWNNLGDFVVGEEDSGRIKAYFPDSGDYRAFRITPSSPYNSFFEIGSIWVFQEEEVLPRNADYGLSINRNQPRVSKTLPNGRSIVTETGVDYCIISGNYSAIRDSENIERLIQKTRNVGAVVILEEHGWFWPVQYQNGSYSVSMPKYNVREQGFEFKEIV